MLPDRVSNLRPLTYESGALPIALRGPATIDLIDYMMLSYLLGVILNMLFAQSSILKLIK